MQNTYSDDQPLYSLDQDGPYRITDLQSAIFKKRKPDKEDIRT